MRVPSTDVQNNFGKYLKFVEAGEEIIVTKKGKDVAKLIYTTPPEPEYVMESAEAYHSRSNWVTYEQYLELVEDSERRYELIDGVIYYLASPSYKHQHTIHELHGAFYNWFKGKDCTPLTSPFDITFFKEENNICVVQPDIVVICDTDNLDALDRYQGVPTLVTEVLSPSTRSRDMLKKLELYQECGVKEYWIVDPINEQVIVYSMLNHEIDNMCTYTKRARDIVQSIYFEGLRVDLTEVFR